MNRFSGVLLAALLLLLGPACEQEASQPEAAGPEAAGDQPAVQLTEVWSLDQGLNRPESVLYDADRSVLYVSNINGAPDAKDGNGYLTRVSPDGAVLDSMWVTGLDAPKGMALSGGRLYVADVDVLLEIDPETGEVAARHPAEGATFLNDVAAGPDGSVYVSDSRASRLYRLQGGMLSVWLEDAGVQAPNGLHVVDGRLLVAAGDSLAQNAGGERYLQAVSLDGQTISPLADRTPIGAVDAVEPDGHGGLFLSDWGAGEVLYFTPETGATVLVTLSQGTADLDYVPETEMLFLPIMMSDRLVAYRAEHAH